MVDILSKINFEKCGIIAMSAGVIVLLITMIIEKIKSR